MVKKHTRRRVQRRRKTQRRRQRGSGFRNALRACVGGICSRRAPAHAETPPNARSSLANVAATGTPGKFTSSEVEKAKANNLLLYRWNELKKLEYELEKKKGLPGRPVTNSGDDIFELENKTIPNQKAKIIYTIYHYRNLIKDMKPSNTNINKFVTDLTELMSVFVSIGHGAPTLYVIFSDEQREKRDELFALAEKIILKLNLKEAYIPPEHPLTTTDYDLTGLPDIPNPSRVSRGGPLRNVNNNFHSTRPSRGGPR